jgi:hypothetical protein
MNEFECAGWLQVEEEAKAVFNCLCTFQNMVETEPNVAEQVRALRSLGVSRAQKNILEQLSPHLPEHGGD